MTKNMDIVPNILTVAGTDPSGGAGIQADLKSISAAEAYGLSVTTAVVAQNTRGVKSINPMPAKCVAEQLDVIFEDIQVDAVKIGMVHDGEIIEVLADRLKRYQPKYIVLDPVIFAKSGDALLDPSALQALKEKLFPLATLITPNLPEAAKLTGLSPAENTSDIFAQLSALLSFGGMSVLLKGGHSQDASEATDWLAEPGQTPRAFSSPRVQTRNDHGTGCTLSSAIAARLPRYALSEAIARAKTYVYGALSHSKTLRVGGGHGPLHHFFNCWPPRADI